MSYTINLHLLDNKQIKVDKGGIPLGNENSYRIYEHEENVTQFEIVSKPAQYENADYYVIFINSQNKRAFLNDIIPDPVTDDGQLIVDDTFMLPVGMAVKGYGYIRIYAIQDNERVEFQPIKVKVWDTVDTWQDYVTELGTPATENWVEDYVDNALAEIDLSNYYTKSEADALFNNINSKIPSAASLENKLVDAAQMQVALNALQQSVENGDIVAGITKQIQHVSPESGSYQEKPFLFQGTGTDSNTTETPTAPIAKHLELRGNTICWNQQINYAAISSDSHWVYDSNTNLYTASYDNTLGTSTKNIFGSFSSVRLVSGHIYYCRVRVVSGSFKHGLYIVNSNQQNLLNYPILTVVNPYSYAQFNARVPAGQSMDVTFSLEFFDLTTMFGAGNEPTELQFNRLFSSVVYPYSKNKLISCKSNKLITTGYNQFSSLDTYIDVIAGQTYRLSYWNGTALAPLTSGSIVEYDGSKTEIKTTTYDNLTSLHTLDASYPDNTDKGLILSIYTKYVKIVNSTNSNILFNLAWDGSRNNYESYIEHTYTLPNAELGSVLSNHHTPTLYYDVYYHNGVYVQNTKQIVYDGIELKAESIWRTNGDYTEFKLSESLLDAAEAPGQTIKYYYANSNRDVIAADTQALGIAFYIQPTNKWVVLSLPTSVASTIAQANTWLQDNNVEVRYVLKEPMTVNDQIFTENVEVDDFGTMKFSTDSTSLDIAPQGNRFFYPADYALLIDDLNNYTNGDVQVLAKKSDISGKQDKLSQLTDLTSTTQTLTLTANTRYALGTLTALNITFPASANDGDEIIIEFVSGSTATTLTRDTTNAIYNFNSVNANVFVELNAQYKVSINKWVVYSAATAYEVPQS